MNTMTLACGCEVTALIQTGYFVIRLEPCRRHPKTIIYSEGKASTVANKESEDAPE